MTASPKKITLAICTYDRYDLLPKAVDSAIAQSLDPKDFRILVSDNSPDHDRAQAFGQRYANVPGLQYVVEKTPGLSNARNLATKMGGTEFIAFMDDDAIASRNWLEEILKAFEAFGPSTMVVGGQVKPIWGVPRPPWVHDKMLGNLSVVNWGGDTRVASQSEWFAGTNITFRTKAILSQGGFATNLGRIGSGATLLSNEEAHLVDCIRLAGGKLVYAPRAIIDHLVDPRRLTQEWFRKRSAWQAVSDFMMDSKKFSVEAKTYWKRAVDYFNSLPPHLRTVRGLVQETEDPDAFLWQIGVIYMMTLMMLNGFDGVELD